MERAIHDILAVRTSQAHRAEAKCHEWQFAESAFARVASAPMEAPRCLPGTGLEIGSGAEPVARSEAGDDGRLPGRRPGAEATENWLPHPPREPIASSLRGTQPGLRDGNLKAAAANSRRVGMRPFRLTKERRKAPASR